MEIPAIVTVEAALLAADELTASAVITLEDFEADVAATLAAFTGMNCFITSTLSTLKELYVKKDRIYKHCIPKLNY